MNTNETLDTGSDDNNTFTAEELAELQALGVPAPLASAPTLQSALAAQRPSEPRIKAKEVAVQTVTRRLYLRNGIIHLCSAGQYFGPQGNKSKLPLDEQVEVTPLPNGLLKVSLTDDLYFEEWEPVVVPQGPARGKKMPAQRRR